MDRRSSDETERRARGRLNRRNFLRSTGVATGVGALYAGGVTRVAAGTDHYPDADQYVQANDYTPASRTANDIKWIVVHATDGEYPGTLNWFADGNPYQTSAHYVIANYEGRRGREAGEVTQMVHNSDIAHHARGSNSHSIGIEHEWDPSVGGYFTDACYRSSARLIEWLADTYDIPLEYYDHPSAMCENDGGIITHRKAPQSYTNYGHCGTLTDKPCPGPDWNEDTLFSYVDDSDGGGGGGVVDEFDEGDRVVTTASSLNGRDAPTLDSNVIQTLPEGTTGDVVDGPEYADGITWWLVDVPVYGTTVWCSGAYLEESDLPEPEDGDPMEFTVETNLNRRLNATGAEIDAAIESLRSDSPLIGLGDTIVDVQNEFTIDSLYILAHAVHESAWGESDIAQDHNNLFGYGASDDDPYGNAARYDSFEQCVWEVMEEVKELYLTPGDWRYNGPHLTGMNVYYATDPEWDVKIADHYRNLAARIDDLQVVDEDDGATDPDPEIADFSEGNRVETSTSTTAWTGDDELSLSAGETGEISSNEYRVEDDGSVYWSVILDDHGWWWVAQTDLQYELRDFSEGDRVETSTSTTAWTGDDELFLGAGETGEISSNEYRIEDDGSVYWSVILDDHGWWWVAQTALQPERDDEDDGDHLFADGDDVVTTADLNGRDQPGLDTDVVVTLPQGTTGEVVNGPEYADDITWWGLYVPEYDEWVWCSENYLDHAEDDATTPDHRFEDGDDVVTTASTLNGRDQPGLDTDVVVGLPEGTTGEVVNGPEYADDITWWGLYVPEYDEWVWCSGNYLEEYDGSTSDPVDDGATFADGDSVVTTANYLNGRRRPHLDADVLQVLPQGTAGEIMNGPQVSNDVTWWGLYVPAYDVYVWCSENYLDRDGSSSTTDGRFDHGDDVVTTASTLNGRRLPGLDYEVQAQLPEGTPARVVNGPAEADGYTWWGLHVTAGNSCCITRDVWVWAAEDYLDDVTQTDTFQMGESVYTTGDLNGRELPGLDYDVVQVLPEGTTGEVVNGPSDADDITWWGLYVPEYDEWVWCSENYLASTL